MRTSAAIALGTLALAAALLPLMLIFDAARPWIALGSMVIGVALLVWWRLDNRRS